MNSKEQSQLKKDKAAVLLKDIIYECFRTDSAVFTELDNADLSAFDHGIREAMWEDYSSNQPTPDWVNAIMNQSSFLIIRSNLGFYNLMIIVVEKDEALPLFFSVGPFRSEDVTPQYFEQIMRDAGIPRARMERAANIFRMLPQVPLSHICSVSKRILSEFYPSVANLEPEIKSFTAEKHEINPDTALLEESQAEFIEKAKDLLMELYKEIKIGNTPNARTALNHYMNHTQVEQILSLSQMKRFVYMLNDLAMATLFTTDVHPTYVTRLATQMTGVINETDDLTRLAYVPYDICHKYCLLVKNHSHPEYSKTTKQVIDYITLHLTEDLSLSAIAEHFQRNASALSASFHKETEVTLSNYVKQARTREAIRLLNSTELPISDISLMVGYDDFAYFSRVFKQVTGVSPQNFRKLT